MFVSTRWMKFRERSRAVDVTCLSVPPCLLAAISIKCLYEATAKMCSEVTILKKPSLLPAHHRQGHQQ